MTIFFIKSLLSLLLLCAAGLSAYSMFEVFGRGGGTVDAVRFKRYHRVFGYAYAALFLLLVYLCAGFVAASRSEPSPRASFHVLLALIIMALFVLKVLFFHAYRQFYNYGKLIGVAIVVLSVGLVGISGGYFLVESGMGKARNVDKSAYYALQGPFFLVKKSGEPPAAAISIDPQSIGRGTVLFQSKCAACHDPESTNTTVGPGLKGLLKNPALPVSKHPATIESLRFQLRQPMGRMPSFAYLSEDEMNDLIAYLNTL